VAPRIEGDGTVAQDRGEVAAAAAAGEGAEPREQLVEGERLDQV